MLRHAFIEQDGEPIQRRFPVLDRHRPLLADVAQCQIVQLDQRILLHCCQAARAGKHEHGLLHLTIAHTDT